MDHMVVVGNSFGALVAMQFVHDFPQAVSHLVLGNGGYLPVLPGPVRKFLALPAVKHVVRRLVRRRSYSLGTLNRSFVDPSKLPAGFFDSIRGNAAAYSTVSFDAALNTTKPLDRPSVPTSLVWGAQDGLAPLKKTQVLQKWLSASTLITINGSGHMLQVEKPQAFIAAIRGMTNRIR
jgi:pimeloyl-ACP methyl ester carboxylesterase